LRARLVLTVITHPEPSISVGSLVRARGRHWVVLPSQDSDVLRLRPLRGGDQDSIGLFLPLEGRNISATSFDPPDPEQAGDAAGGFLLRDAARLSIRSGAAPFRSLGRISVTPRPYQFVPLVMALRLETVRLLIADDVGVGKTIEAAMIARELLDRGQVQRLAVVCPAHLCEQWQSELREKFGIDAAVVQPATIGRLERNLPRRDLSIYRWYRHLIVSIDFVKSDRNRHHFLQNAPDLVILDEAHIATRPPSHAANPQHQRYELVRALADDPERSMILVTATPHSGIEESFRSLLGLLDAGFDVDGSDELEELSRQALLPHVVQRRRADLAHWLGSTTPFPERVAEERAYTLSPGYHALFDKVLAYCRETIRGGEGLRRQQQRVRHWAAIALLRCVLSSPDAAVAVLSERARRQGLDVEESFKSEDDMDAVYRPQVLDPIEEGASGDYAPTAPLEDAEPVLTDSERRRLSDFLRQARELAGPEKDRKLQETVSIVRELLWEGHRPIVFCRFIATAKYVAQQLPKALAKEFPSLAVQAVTGEIGDEMRRIRVEELAAQPLRVLVATDCLSEGINLQESFDAVVHYDLPWNPNRLEQREGRVDRFGQQKQQVKTVVLHGADNPVDRVVLDVLIRKARTIRRQLGIAVPVPAESDGVVQAVVDSVLLQGRTDSVQLQLGLTDPEVSRLHQEWERAAQKEGRQRAFFAQRGIQPDEVAQELAAVDPVLGDMETLRSFLGHAAQRLGGELRPTKQREIAELLPGAEMANLLRERAAWDGHASVRIAFDGVARDGVLPLTRTHPLVAAYCDVVLGKAMHPDGDERFARCGAIYTDAVDIRTAVTLLRLRYLLRDVAEEFAEEVVLAAFRRESGRPVWLEPLDGAGSKLQSSPRPAANMAREERAGHVRWALDLLHCAPDAFEPVVRSRQEQLGASNDRLRRLLKGKQLSIEPKGIDILGMYVLVPVGGR